MANESTRIDKSLSFRVLASPPPNPAMDELYFDLTAQALLRWNGATWAQAFGGAGSGSKNYLTTYTASFGAPAQNPGNGDIEDGSTLGWSLGTVGTLNANNLPVGTPTFGSGSSSNLSLNTVTGGTQLAGTYSLSYVSSAATTQGDMLASSPFFIDQEDQASVLGFSFSYKAAVGAADMNLSGTSANSFAVAVWDATNDEFLGTAGIFNLIQSSGVGKCTGTFQTLANTEKLNFIVYNANVTASGSSTPTIQQSAPSTPFVGFTALISPTDYVAQSFTFGSSTTVTEFDVYLSNFNGSGGSTFPGTISVQILNDNAGVPNLSSVVATSTNSIDTSTFPPNSSFSVLNTFNFNPTILAPGTTYWFAIIPDSTYLSGASSSNHVSLSVTSNGPSYDTYTSGSWSSTASEGFGYNIWGYLTPSSTPVTMLFDDFFVGPQVSVSAPAMTDWQSNNNLSTNLSTSNNSFFTRRVGDSLEVIYTCSSVVSAAGASAYIQLPYTIDITKLGAAYQTLLGVWTSGNSTNVSIFPTDGEAGTAFFDGSINNQVFLAYQQNTNYQKVNATSITTPGGDITVRFTVPIAGWSSNTAMSSDTDTRVVAARVEGAATTGPSSTNYIIFPTTDFDTHGKYNASTGIYTVPVSGFYVITGYVEAFLGAASLRVFAVQNGTNPIALGITSSTGADNYASPLSGVLECVAGDAIGIGINASGTLSANSYLSINRLSGPAVVAATETVVAVYNSPSAMQSPNTSGILIFPNKVIDTHNEYNTSTGVYTVPVSGNYLITAVVGAARVTANVGDYYYVWASQNGAPASNLVEFANFGVQSTSNQVVPLATGSIILPCNTGDTLSINVGNSETSSWTWNFNYGNMSISRVR